MRFKAPLDSCASCGGLVPQAHARQKTGASCPHCGEALASGAGRALGKVAGAAAVAVAGAGFAVTLMACYGPPPREYEKADAPQPPRANTMTDAGSPDMPKAK